MIEGVFDEWVFDSGAGVADWSDCILILKAGFPRTRQSHASVTV